MPRKIKQNNPSLNPENTEPEFFSEKVKNISPIKTKTKKGADFTKQIASIYENSSPQMIAPKKKGRGGKIIFLTILILAFLTAISWAGFFLFGQGPNFSEEKISVIIKNEEPVQFGQKVTYDVEINNSSRSPLNSNLLTMRYPNNFKFISADPAPNNGDNKEWSLGTLMPGDKILIKITGLNYEATTAEMSWQALLNYKPGDLSAEFQKIAVFKQKIEPFNIDFKLNIPATAETGNNLPLTISLNNNSGKDLENLQVVLKLPIGFKNLTVPNNIWIINKFPSASSTSFTAVLSPTTEAQAGEQNITAKLSLKNDIAYFEQQSISQTINLNKSDLTLSVTANNTEDKQNINFGDKLTFKITYENSGTVEFKNGTVRLVLDTPSSDNKSLFDWNTIQDKYDGAITAEQISPQIRRAVITWTKKQIPELAKIKPGDKKSWEVSLSVKPKNSLNLSGLTEFKTNVYAETSITKDSNPQPDTIQSNNLFLFLNSDLSLSTQTTVKNTEKITSSNSTYNTRTNYSVNWTLANSLHELTNLQIFTILPENVDWGNNGSTNAGDITFDKNTKQLTWKLNRLPVSFNQVNISFDLGLKYASKNSGIEKMLLDKIQISAQDKVTGQEINLTKDPTKILP